MLLMITTILVFINISAQLLYDQSEFIDLFLIYTKCFSDNGFPIEKEMLIFYK